MIYVAFSPADRLSCAADKIHWLQSLTFGNSLKKQKTNIISYLTLEPSAHSSHFKFKIRSIHKIRDCDYEIR